MLSSAQACPGAAELVGLYSRSFSPKKPNGLSASRRYFVTEAAVYSSLDARSTSRARDLLTRPACGRPTRCEDAAPKSPEARRQFTRTEPSPAGVRETVRRRAWVTGARGTNATGAARTTRRRGSTGYARRGARLAETAIARETVARRRGAGSRALSLSVPRPLLSVDRRRRAPSSSSKRSALVQLCWHIS